MLVIWWLQPLRWTQHLDLRPLWPWSWPSWPWPWTNLSRKAGKHDFHVWRLTYDIDLQSHPREGQGQPPCKKYRSWVQLFSHESADRQTRHTYRRLIILPLPLTLEVKMNQLCMKYEIGLWWPPYYRPLYHTFWPCLLYFDLDLRSRV